MASQSVPLTESIQFPATQTLQPGPSDQDSAQSPQHEEATPEACSESGPDEPSEVVLTYREFEEIQDCSSARISHRLPTAEPQSSALTALRSVGLLDVQTVRLRGPRSRRLARTALAPPRDGNL